MKNILLSDKLIAAIQDYMPVNQKSVPFLMDILDISRESAYRRVRGDIPLTLEEAAIISAKLGLSLDELVGQNNKERAFFDLNVSKTPEATETYSQIINNINNIYEKIRKAKSSEVIIANNRVSIVLTANYEYIKKFRYFKWVHQTHNVPLNFYFSELEVPSQLNADYKKYAYNYLRLNNITLIIDKNVFSSLIDEMLYYYRRNLIDKEELKAMQEELRQIVNELEQILQTGTNKAGVNMLIYLSALNIESNYSYLEYDGNVCSQFWVYTVNPIMVFNHEACAIQKKWLESLMKYSTLITKSNELLQAEFLNTQREYIEAMISD